MRRPDDQPIPMMLALTPARRTCINNLHTTVNESIVGQIDDQKVVVRHDGALESFHVVNESGERHELSIDHPLVAGLLVDVWQPPLVERSV